MTTFNEQILAGKLYCCRKCSTHLSNAGNVISKNFHGRHGRAYLMKNVVNIITGPPEEREMSTGLHRVADVICQRCVSILGWTYFIAFEQSEKYKEGKFVIEKKAMKKVTGWKPQLLLSSKAPIIKSSLAGYECFETNIHSALNNALYKYAIQPQPKEDRNNTQHTQSSSSTSSTRSEPISFSFRHWLTGLTETIDADLEEEEDSSTGSQNHPADDSSIIFRTDLDNMSSILLALTGVDRSSSSDEDYGVVGRHDVNSTDEDSEEEDGLPA